MELLADVCLHRYHVLSHLFVPWFEQPFGSSLFEYKLVELLFLGFGARFDDHLGHSIPEL